ncbi:MAG TPA: glutamate-cysteine ligase family protein [Patescibacteria group bacterium]|nr:glutamate-cysteine ligase family protein [Patescibacteria group bacterium]
MRESKIQNLIGFRERLVGLEFENPVIDRNGEPPSFYFMQKVWTDFGKIGWKINKDDRLKIISSVEKDFGGKLVNLSSDSSAGNFEMALPPMPGIKKAHNLLKLVHKDIFRILKKRNLSMIGLGIHPGNLGDHKKLVVRSALYDALCAAGAYNYFDNAIMMANSAHQAGISIKLNEAVKATNELIKITGLVTALCANSPIQNWKMLPVKEWRMLCWDFRLVSNYRGFEKLAGFSKKPFSSLSELFRYYLSTPFMMLPPTRETGWTIPDKKINYLQYFKKKEVASHDLSGKKVLLKPESKDVNLAMIIFWPHAKIHLVADPQKISVSDFMKNLDSGKLEEYLDGKLVNCYIEYRGAGASPVGEELALPALILGLVNNIGELEKFTKCLSWKQWEELVRPASIKGLNFNFEGHNIIRLCEKLVSIAEKGLGKRKSGEEKYLDILKKRIKDKRVPADMAISKFKEGKKEFLKYVSY